MEIKGSFVDIYNKNKYELTISSPGSGQYNIKDDNTGNICFTDDPITISCDYVDTFNHIIIKSAKVQLLTNINLKDIVMANNNRDISLTITATNLENDTTSTLFYGYVEPLCFNEPYAYQWETIEITATDILASSQYIKYPPLMSEDNDSEEDEINPWDDMWTPIQTLTKIADNLELTLDLSKLSNDVRTALSGTKISNSIWIGSQDEWKTCYEVLEQLGKYWNLWFVVDEDNLVGFDWHDMTRSAVTLTKNDVADTDTNLSNADAYTQIKLACNVEDADAIIEFGDDLISPYEHYALYLDELVSEGGGDNAYAAYKDLLLNNVTYNEGRKNSYIYKNFCWVKKSNLWDFGQNGYTQFLPDPDNHYGGTTQQTILQWLKNNRGKAAFVSFGRTDKSQSTDNSPINSIELKDYLIISIMGDDTVGNMTFNGDICSFEGSSTAFTPADSNTTNYIVISGQILLNKLYAQTGYPMHAKYKKNGGGEYEDVNGNVGADSLHTYEEALNILSNSSQGTYGQEILYEKTVQRIGDNDYGSYYNHKYYNGNAGSEEYTSTQCLYGDLKQDKYNKTMKYEYSYIDGKGKKVDNTSKIPILECQLKIGNKYCVERIDKSNGAGWGEFEWLTEEQIISNNIKVDNEYWYNFTIGIDPKCDDYIIGQTYDIQNTIWYYDDIEGKGTAIPIHFSDALAGPVTFKIIKPFNITWEKASKSVHGWLWHRTHWSLTYQPILEKLSSIMVSNFKIDLVSDKGKIQNNTANNDLVYASDMNDKYIEDHEDDVDICTMITSQEAADWGTDMVISKSHVVNSDGTPFYGYAYRVTDDNDQPVLDENDNQVVAYTKPEQLYVDGFYQEYFVPRTIIESTIFFRHNYGWMINPTKYIFNVRYVENNPNYVPISYDTDLKYNRMTVSFKDMKYKAYEEE